MPVPTADPADDEVWQRVVRHNVERVKRTLVELSLPAPVAAFALWLSNEADALEPIAISVCTEARWTELAADATWPADRATFGRLMTPQMWDFDNRDVLEVNGGHEFDAAAADVVARYDEALDPASITLDETARRVLLDLPVPATPTVFGFASDMHYSDQFLASIRYAASPAAQAYLRGLGLLPGSLTDLEQTWSA